MKLQGKTALITGATTGIGRATAERFIAEGVKKLIITGQDEARLQSAQRELSAADVVVTAIRWRADQPVDTQELLASLQKEASNIDILFVNAGVTWPAPLGQIDAQQAQAQMMVNFTAPIMLVQALVPVLNEGSSIIFTTSCLNVLGMAGMTVYSASKAALRSAARSLSVELIEQGIRVNSVAPGPVQTPIYSKLGMSEEQLGEMASGIVSQVPAGRFGTSDEIAAAVSFLASDDSSYMRGEEIAVDGGWSTL